MQAVGATEQNGAHLYRPPARNARKFSSVAPLYAVSAPRMSLHPSLASSRLHARCTAFVAKCHCSRHAALQVASQASTGGSRWPMPIHLKAAPITPPPLSPLPSPFSLKLRRSMARSWAVLLPLLLWLWWRLRKSPLHAGKGSSVS
eukprot:1138316-Pelagomonas_calceolata.AAC.6